MEQEIFLAVCYHKEAERIETDLLRPVHVGRAGAAAPLPGMIGDDTGLPDDGVIALGPYDTPGWTFAEIDPDRFAAVRRDGQVRTRAHWPEQKTRLTATGTILR